jgi:hypothetical protein
MMTPTQAADDIQADLRQRARRSTDRAAGEGGRLPAHAAGRAHQIVRRSPEQQSASAAIEVVEPESVWNELPAMRAGGEGY